MKTPLALLAIAFLCGAVLVDAQPKSPAPTWHSDWATAQRIARKENKPIFAVLVCKH